MRTLPMTAVSCLSLRGGGSGYEQDYKTKSEVGVIVESDDFFAVDEYPRYRDASRNLTNDEMCMRELRSALV